MDSQPIVVLVTTPSQEQASAIAQTLVAEKLAACVNLFPIHSIYTWNGELQQEQEWQLIIKTDHAQFPALETLICDRHPYEVPEIIALPIVAGASAYLNWLSSCLIR
jgi:periplasmic divalent cation tolerance protein